MRRYIGHLIALAIIVLLGFTVPTGQALSEPNPGGQQPASGEAEFAPGRILVKVEDNAPADAIATLNRKNDAHVEEKIFHSGVSVVDLPEDLSVAEAVEVYEASAAVEYAEPDYKLYAAISAPTPSDPSFPKMYDLNNRGQSSGTFDADVDAPEAWLEETGDAATVVAVIDTGVDISHPDLNDNIWTNPGESGLDAAGKDKATNCVDDDGNGLVDDVHGWDFRATKMDKEDHDGGCIFTPSDDGADPSVFDGGQQDWHGTHVSGTIAAEGNNDRGVTGVNWQAKIMPLKFIGPGNFGYVSDAAAALDYAVSKGVKISNNSYGGWYDSCNGCYARTLRDAISRADMAGHLYVAAAMNGGPDFVGDNTDANPIYPTGYDNPNIISVAASNNQDELTSFSNYGDMSDDGHSSVDLAAPGINILSTVPGNKYSYGLGTSMAAPHVTGVAALINSQYPDLRDDAIKSRILANVDKVASMADKLESGGRLNAAKALGANTAPVIVGLGPGGSTRDRTPLISATVRDEETDLTQSQIQLYIDNNQKLDFTYDQANDTLIYNSGKLANRRHRVQIVADDGQGLQEIRTWSFFAGRRR